MWISVTIKLKAWGCPMWPKHVAWYNYQTNKGVLTVWFYTLKESLRKCDLHVRLSTKHGKETVRAHNEVQLSNSKYEECKRHKQYSECTSEVVQEIRQIWATSQDKSPDGDLYPVTLSHDLRGSRCMQNSTGLSRFAVSDAGTIR